MAIFLALLFYFLEALPFNYSGFYMHVYDFSVTLWVCFAVLALLSGFVLASSLCILCLALLSGFLSASSLCN